MAGFPNPVAGNDQSQDRANVDGYAQGNTIPTAVAGANAGTSPPVPVVVPGSNDIRGQITFGTGTTPAAGSQAVVTFAKAFDKAPNIQLTWANGDATQALYVSPTATGFTISVVGALTGSKANSFYAVNYHVIP